MAQDATRSASIVNEFLHLNSSSEFKCDAGHVLYSAEALPALLRCIHTHDDSEPSGTPAELLAAACAVGGQSNPHP